jgi:copper chaperone CopZ
MKKRASSWTLAGGVLAAIVASLCCLGPFLALSLGLGSFAAATFFAQWRPLFLLLTFVLLGVAWLIAYRRPRSDCGDATCARRPGRVMRISLGVGTLIAIVAATYPWLAGSLHGAAPAVTASAGEKISVSIPTMDCAACAKGIEASLQRAPGVLQARVNYDIKRVDIAFDPAVTNGEKLLAQIDSTGFPVDRTSLK